MTYVGKEASQCDPIEDEFATVIVVNGSTGNPCGHGLLHWGGLYWHVAGVRKCPHVMDEKGWRQYRDENGKYVKERLRVKLTQPHKANEKLCWLIAKPWVWGVLPHNCFNFVEEVVQAGGGDYSLLTNCHLMER